MGRDPTFRPDSIVLTFISARIVGLGANTQKLAAPATSHTATKAKTAGGIKPTLETGGGWAGMASSGGRGGVGGARMGVVWADRREKRR